MKTNTHYIAIVKLALMTGGRIPATIPAHHVTSSYTAHREARGLVFNKLEFNPLLCKPIRL